MLGRWLTNQYHPMLLTRKQVNSDAISEQRFFPRADSRFTARTEDLQPINRQGAEIAKKKIP